MMAQDAAASRPQRCHRPNALSGGGIRSRRSASPLQALLRVQAGRPHRLPSTVSGGGHVGTLQHRHTAQAFPLNRPQPGDAFPFGDDIADNAAMGHLRNYSNYLLPRGRSGLRNYAEVTAVLLRGLLANAAQVALVLLFCALLTISAFRCAISPIRAASSASSPITRHAPSHPPGHRRPSTTGLGAEPFSSPISCWACWG